jgi:hypothetical protein
VIETGMNNKDAHLVGITKIFRFMVPCISDDNNE